LTAAVRVEGEKLLIDYDATIAGARYVAPSVMLEFGARSTGEGRVCGTSPVTHLAWSRAWGSLRPGLE